MEQLYDLRINFDNGTGRKDVKVYKEYKQRPIQNIMYWISKYENSKNVLSFEIIEN